GPRGGEPRLMPAPGPRKASFHQSGADQRHRRALDFQVRPTAPRGAFRSQTTAGRGQAMTNSPSRSFVYVTYIRTTPERLWSALTDPEFTKKSWYGMHQASEWKTGSPWRLVFADGRVADTGEILEIDPPRRVVIKWRNEFRPELKAEGHSRCTI